MRRMEALSDGGISYAATFMVVSMGLEEPLLARDVRLPELSIFEGGFFVLIALLAAHFSYIRRAAHVDYCVITYNTVLLVVVLCYLFPPNCLINTWSGGEPISVAGQAILFIFYGLGFRQVFLYLLHMSRRACKKPKSVSRSLFPLFHSRHFAIYARLASLSIGASTMSIVIRYGLHRFNYAILGPKCNWHSGQFEKIF